MDTKRWWIVGHDGKTWGPFERQALAALVAEGKLRGDGLVCPEGEARWSPIGSFAELSDVSWPPAAPPRVEPGSATLPPCTTPPLPSTLSILRPNELDAIPGWQTVLLSIPTLGLWGMFCFYRTMHVYRRLAQVPTTNAELLFWILIAATAFGALTLPVGVGWAVLVGAVVVGAFLLRETLRLRDLAIQRLVPAVATTPAQYPAVKSDDWHFGLWITGAVLTTTLFGAIVGVPILIAQALAWFEDWNRVAGLARGEVASRASVFAA